MTMALTACVEVAHALRRHRRLTYELAMRELRDRHVGSTLGMVWVFLHPLFQLSVYAVVFTQVFRLKLGGTADQPFSYSVYIFAGLLPWLAITESLSKSAVALTSNASLVKQVVFPIEVLTVKSALSVMFVEIIGLSVAATYTLISEHTLPLTYLLLPIPLALQFFTLCGLGWGLSTIGAFFKDLKELVQVSLVVMVYLIPAFYIDTWVPRMLRVPILLNPFTHLIYTFQDAMYYGRIAHPLSWVIATLTALCAVVFGYGLFRKCRNYIGSVL